MRSAAAQRADWHGKLMAASRKAAGEKRNRMKIRTTHVDGIGWSAVDDADPGGAIGTGDSEWAAVEDLIHQLKGEDVPQAELNSALWDWFRNKYQRDADRNSR
jgi:hypothetical protein